LVVVLVAGFSSTCGDDPKSSPAPAAVGTNGEIRATGSGTVFGGGTQPVDVSGGSFSARLTVSGNCQWTVTSDAAWVTPEAAGTCVGSGLFTYRVASNAAVAHQARLSLFTSQPSGVLAITPEGANRRGTRQGAGALLRAGNAKPILFAAPAKGDRVPSASTSSAPLSTRNASRHGPCSS
jgi:hypothetical protein